MPNVQFDSSDTYIVRTSQMIYYVPWTVGGGWCLLPWRLLDTCCNGNPGAQGHGPALDVLRNIWMNKLCAAARRRMAKMEDLLFLKCAARFACGVVCEWIAQFTCTSTLHSQGSLRPQMWKIMNRLQLFYLSRPPGFKLEISSFDTILSCTHKSIEHKNLYSNPD